ncbi:hypothetical protein BD770DRAFT_395446 [Pilaira anomala]|nr:hypothetical protein BD770DRAFT_395446 [Pilaira anomala]
MKKKGPSGVVLQVTFLFGRPSYFCIVEIKCVHILMMMPIFLGSNNVYTFIIRFKFYYFFYFIAMAVSAIIQ